MSTGDGPVSPTTRAAQQAEDGRRIDTLHACQFRAKDFGRSWHDYHQIPERTIEWSIAIRPDEPSASHHAAPHDLGHLQTSYLASHCARVCPGNCGQLGNRVFVIPYVGPGEHSRCRSRTKEWKD
jgi:hypothetical protein